MLSACSRNMSSSKSKRERTLEEEDGVDSDFPNESSDDEEYDESESRQTQTRLLIAKDDIDESRRWTFDQNKVREALAHMIIIDGLSFWFVEGEGFQLFMRECCPQFVIPSPLDIARDVYRIYLDLMVKLRDYLVRACERVCVTTDTWTSLNGTHYVAITCHFIDDDWKLQKKILNFCAVSDPKGGDVANLVRKCLDFWGLTSKLYTVVVDDAGSNSVAYESLVDECKRRGNFLVSNGDFLHARCVGHVFNLFVWDGLKIVGKSVKRVRAAVRYIKQSPSRMRVFEECARGEDISGEEVALFLDCPDRWDSTYKMLSTALVYEHAFSRYSERDRCFNVDLTEDDEADRPPNANDWKQVKHLSVFLEVFYNATLRLSGTQHVTPNLLIFEISEIHTMLRKMEQTVENIDVDDEESDETESSGSKLSSFVEMGTRMRMKFDEYFGAPEKMNPLVYIAFILDPRFKLKGLEICLCELYGEEKGRDLATKAKEKLEALFNEYCQLYKPENAQNWQSGDTPIQRDMRHRAHTSCVFMEKIKRKMNAKGKTELQKYLDEDFLGDSDDNDILGWWKSYGPIYPVVARMARDILAVPVSTVASSESAFSAGGCHLDLFRTYLPARLLQAVICAQDWLRTNTGIDLADTFEEPQDLDKYLASLSVKDNVVDVVEII